MRIIVFELCNDRGDQISVSNYGARLLKWLTPVEDHSRNIILGYDKLEDYLNDPYFIGAMVGPYANRIAHSSCEINGKKITLDANEGQHHLHGGNTAIANLYWQCIEHTPSHVTLSCHLPDGFNGYPGPIKITVSYALSNHSELTVDIKVSSEQTTIAGPTAHPYFNLCADQHNSSHNLQLLTQYHTPIDQRGIPMGFVDSVEKSIYDHQQPKALTEAQPLDNNFLFKLNDRQDRTVYKQAILQSGDGKLQLHVSSNYPALQVYSGGYLQQPFTPFQGICLEPQFCPDSPNQPSFPFQHTDKQQPLNRQIKYCLFTA
jgi:aldose 1-epimerase